MCDERTPRFRPGRFLELWLRADLLDLQRFEGYDATADALRGVEADVRLVGERVAQDADTRAIDDLVGLAEVTVGHCQSVGADRGDVGSVVARLPHERRLQANVLVERH